MTPPLRTPTRGSPRVSVVVPFLDAERFLGETVESVHNQTFQDWELLLIDDGSSDRSPAMARELAAAFPGRIFYLQHPGHVNRGMSASRNLGFGRARGELFALLDSDDIWRPEYLARQVSHLDRNPSVGMVYSNTRYWFGWTGLADDEAKDYSPVLGVPSGAVVTPPALLIGLIRQEIAAPCTCAAIVRHQAFERVGGFEEQFTGSYEDQAFFAKVFLREKVLVVDEDLNYYRQHPDSCWARQRAAGESSIRRRMWLGWLREYLESEMVADPALWRALRSAERDISYPGLKRVRALMRRLADRAKLRPAR